MKVRLLILYILVQYFPNYLQNNNKFYNFLVILDIVIGLFHATDERMIRINGVRQIICLDVKTELLLKFGTNNLSDVNCLPLSVKKDS